MVPDQISTIQQNGHSTLGWVFTVVPDQVVPFSEEKGSWCCSKNQHSLSLREAFSAIPSLSRKYTNFDAVRGLVKISAIYSSIRMYCNFKIHFALGIWWNDTSFQCVSIYHETVGSPKSLCNFDSRNGWLLSQTEPNCFHAGITCSNIFCLSCTLS